MLQLRADSKPYYMRLLLVGTPRGIDFNLVTMTLKQIPGVTEIHDLRIWSLTTSKIAMSVHLALGELS